MPKCRPLLLGLLNNAIVVADSVTVSVRKTRVTTIASCWARWWKALVPTGRTLNTAVNASELASEKSVGYHCSREGPSHVGVFPDPPTAKLGCGESL